MSEYLERDEDYEPVTLPSAAELLHPEVVTTSPDGTPSVQPVAEGAVIPPVPPPAPQEEITRFISRARPRRYALAAAVTAGGLAGIAWGAASIGSASGATGIGVFLAAIAVMVVCVVSIVSVWRWARKRRSGIPTRRSDPVELGQERPAE